MSPREQAEAMKLLQAWLDLVGTGVISGRLFGVSELAERTDEFIENNPRYWRPMTAPTEQVR